MSTCATQPCSPCRTGKGKVAVQYHTVPFRRAWARQGIQRADLRRTRARLGLDRAAPPGKRRRRTGRTRPPRLPRASTARQSLDAQLDSLAEAGATRVFSEKISTRATKRPELEAAVRLAGEIRSSGVRVTLVVHEHKCLGRRIELAMLAEELKASEVGLEFITGELTGSHDPSGIVFTVLAAISGMEREYIRDRTLEGHEPSREHDKTTGGAGVTDDDILAIALHLRDIV